MKGLSMCSTAKNHQEICIIFSDLSVCLSDVCIYIKKKNSSSYKFSTFHCQKLYFVKHITSYYILWIKIAASALFFSLFFHLSSPPFNSLLLELYRSSHIFHRYTNQLPLPNPSPTPPVRRRWICSDSFTM